MRTLHQQAPAYRRNSLLASSVKHSVAPQALHPHKQPAPNRLEQSPGKTLSLALTAGFSAHFIVLLFCLLTGVVSGIAPSLLLSSLVGLTAFCLGLAFTKGSR